MADSDERKGASRTTDLVTLLAGIATLLVSAYVLSDANTWFPHVDLRWALGGGAALVGVLMLVASMRPRKSGR
ncbi:hypothetical protein ACWGRK_00385 [Saccharomonospora azurea]|uniref:Uncharacterized protein n=1 Tax=Saccharomonospora azurea NA-128 TaxID=882081 RepID=H8G4U8_9PSEU|nr:hypothetical protein [Saccharomonospora azurea]EHY90165.1 hypothetical protein SacazDRAFT_03288 [Saccharomonospora azurea NA-128]